MIQVFLTNFEKIRPARYSPDPVQKFTRGLNSNAEVVHVTFSSSEPGPAPGGGEPTAWHKACTYARTSWPLGTKAFGQRGIGESDEKAMGCG